MRKYREKFPERTRFATAKYRMKQEHKPEPELWTRPKPDRCEVCGRSPKEQSDRALSYDHEHSTGLFRGWLCGRCNMCLGYIETPEHLDKLAEYLRNYEHTRKEDRLKRLRDKEDSRGT